MMKYNILNIIIKYSFFYSTIVIFLYWLFNFYNLIIKILKNNDDDDNNNNY